MSARSAFFRGEALALFLDVDGTLLEIAATPDRVRVPASLRNTLHLACVRERGAFALMSGRPLAELDQLFAPYRFPASGKHGLEVRLPSGQVIQPDIDPAILDGARCRLRELPREHRGLLFEDKEVALAMHFRLVPWLEPAIMVIMRELVDELGGWFVLRRGKCVLEIVPRGFNERRSIELFMQQREFAGRTPVFVGDDPSDEVGFHAINQMGGHSIRVGDLAQTAARYRFSSVLTVAAWLRDRNLNR